MSRQHFEMIAKLTKSGELRKFEQNNTIYQDPSPERRKVSDHVEVEAKVEEPETDKMLTSINSSLGSPKKIIYVE